MRSRRAGAASAFLAQGLVFVLLTTKLPEVQERFDLSPGDFSLYMLGLIIAAGAGSLLGEAVAPRAGSAVVVRAGFALSAVTVPLLANAPNRGVLAAMMAVYGLAIGAVDAGSNMQGVAIEHEYGRPIMPTFHAAWTAGGILGTVLSWLTHTMSFAHSSWIVALVPLAVVGAPLLGRQADVAPSPDAERLRVPWRLILPVGAALVLFYMVDTAVTAWGPTYVHRVFDAPPWLVAIATLPYLVAALLGRVAGDGLTARFGATSLVRVSAGLGAAGLAVVVFAPVAAVAMLGFLVLGFGLAVVAPLSYSAAARIARLSGQSDVDDGGATTQVAHTARVDAVIARFNQFNYAGGLLGAVMTGAVGDGDLRVGFAVPMVLVLLIAPLARAFR